ncbi:hypothetical protein [Spirosoma endbachense]|uniref:Uncharacterized protein n=1 Tax=Spirosoma endbachense TaxID=2666025 RepID=A0A6P1W1S4_9BACT|nr:hypothetical protein [Spirosoma endbachense]QHV99381.1 hypothetical protein GJR95_32140 [Spirosoma endbachense]
MGIAAHGGQQRWDQVYTLTTHYKLAGVIWAIKGQEDILSDVTSRIELHHQEFRNLTFVSADQRSVFDPDRVAIETQSGQNSSTTHNGINRLQYKIVLITSNTSDIGLIRPRNLWHREPP